MARYIDAEKVTYNKIRESSLTDDLTDRELKTIIQVFRNLPTEDVVPIVRGKWLKSDSDENCYCSKCRGYWLECFAKRMIYCPNCGAKMEESGEEE